MRDAGREVAALNFAFDGAGRVRHIHIMRNPDKLRRLADGDR